MRELNEVEIRALPKTMLHGVTVLPDVVKHAQFQADMEGFIEWGDEECPHRSSNAKYFKPRKVCCKCWQALLGEVE